MSISPEDLTLERDDVRMCIVLASALQKDWIRHGTRTINIKRWLWRRSYLSIPITSFLQTL